MMISRNLPTLLTFIKLLRRYTGRNWWISVLWWMTMVSVAQALELRVAIKDGVSEVKVGSSTNAVLSDSSGQTLGQLPAMNSLEAYSSSGRVALGNWKASEIWIQPTAGGYVWIGDRWYRGRTRLISTHRGLTAVNQVDLEDYLYSVLGAEMDGSWPQEALKAQAVAARSFALYKRQTSGNKIYDVGNTTTWQVYKGLNTESPGTHSAVDSTLGQVLTYNNKIILAVFHSASGGHTENVEDVWSDHLPYLRGVSDYDQGTPEYQWEKTFSRTQLSQRLGIGNIISLIPERTTRNGRIITMKVVGDNGIKHISGDRLRQILGLRSTCFTVYSTANAFQINGRGYGHGLGMSQWGAYNLAQQGINYQQILLHYYQGTNIAKLGSE